MARQEGSPAPDGPVEAFEACEGVERLFHVGWALAEELVDTGHGVWVTAPRDEHTRFRREGERPLASLSPEGVFAVYHRVEYYEVIQFTDLRKYEREREVDVEGCSIAAFYDDRVLILTEDRPLVEAWVDEMLEEGGEGRVVRGSERATPWTDVSLVNTTRVLHYRTPDCRLCAYDVDRRVSRIVDVGRGVVCLASLTGLDTGVLAVFQDEEGETYALASDHSVARLPGGPQDEGLTDVFPSRSAPWDLTRAVLKYGDTLTKGGRDIQEGLPSGGPLLPQEDYTFVRLRGDVFLYYDTHECSWALTRIVVE